jgi:hypothetical protein
MINYDNVIRLTECRRCMLRAARNHDHCEDCSITRDARIYIALRENERKKNDWE